MCNVLLCVLFLYGLIEYKYWIKRISFFTNAKARILLWWNFYRYPKQLDDIKIWKFPLISSLPFIFRILLFIYHFFVLLVCCLWKCTDGDLILFWLLSWYTIQWERVVCCHSALIGDLMMIFCSSLLSQNMNNI